MVMVKANLVQRKQLQLAFYGVCALLLILLVFREWGAFKSSLNALGDVSVLWPISGFIVLLISVAISSALYGVLSPRRLRYRRTLLVQTGSLGVNRLLPAGSGALGVAYLYLRANKVSKTAAAAVVAGNNILGFIGHALLVGIMIIANPAVFGHFAGLNTATYRWWLGAAAILLVAFVIGGLLAARSKLPFARSLQPLLLRPSRFGSALGLSMLITACYAAAVMLAARALGYELSPAAGLIVLSFGVAAASAVPTPGGIGSAEAGIFAGLHAYGVETTDALTIALLYRVMTFWLPLIVGGIAFVVVDRLGFLRVSPQSTGDAAR